MKIEIKWHLTSYFCAIALVTCYLYLKYAVREPYPFNLITWWGGSGILIQAGQWWRLITCQFIEISFFEVIVDLIVIYIFYTRYEKIWGSIRTLIVLLVSAIVGSLYGLYFNPFEFMYGASLCGCGIIGGLERMYLPQFRSLWGQNRFKLIILCLLIPYFAVVDYDGGLIGYHLISIATGAVITSIFIYMKGFNPVIIRCVGSSSPSEIVKHY